MKRKLSYFTTLLGILIITSCSAQKTLPTAEFVNSHYYNLLPQGKSKLSVIVTVMELQEVLKQVINPLYAKGDTLLAKQFSDLHATLTYDKTIDSVTILLSPLDVDESSAFFEGSENIKAGYYDMVSGAFMQFRSLLIDGLLSSKQSENEIISESDKTSVDVIKNGSQIKYTFSNDYKEVTMSGSIDNQKITGLIKANALGDKLVFNYQEFTTPQLKSIINISYYQEGNTILPSGVAIKNEMKPMSVEMTMVFSEWEFE